MLQGSLSEKALRVYGLIGGFHGDEERLKALRSLAERVHDGSVTNEELLTGQFHQNVSVVLALAASLFYVGACSF